MKNILISIVIILMIAFFSCKKDNYVEMKIEKDCTGTYLRGKYYSLNEEDFMVCNENILDGYKDGDIINVCFERIKDCNSNHHVCMMVHQHPISEIVEVKKIK